MRGFEAIPGLAGALALVALVAGCGDAGPKAPPVGAGGEAGAGGLGGAAVIPTPAWTDDSQGIDVRCSGYFSGAMRFQASRQQLTADELSLLGGLRTAGMSTSCTVDGMSCQVAITQSDGGVRTFAAAQDGWCRELSQELISFATLKPFLDALPCPFLRAGEPVAVPLPLDARCFDTVGSGQAGSSFPVDVVDLTTPLHAELDSCDDAASAGALSLAVLDVDGTTVLGTGTSPADSGPNHTCSLLTATVSHPGRLTVSVRGTVPAGVAPLLRVYQ